MHALLDTFSIDTLLPELIIHMNFSDRIVDAEKLSVRLRAVSAMYWVWFMHTAAS